MKKRNIYLIAAASFMALSTACGRIDLAGLVINRSDTEERVNDWLNYNIQNGEPVFDNVPDNYRVYATSDSHYADRDSIAPQGEKDRVYRFVTAERNDPRAIFSILNGDLANQGGEAPYKMIDAALEYNAATQLKNDPCFPTIGNHDVYYDCAGWFKQHYHTSTYSVVVKTVGGHKDLFLFLDSANGTHGKAQLSWLKEKLSHRSDYRNCVVISHSWIFRTAYNYTTTPAANLPEDEQYDFMDLMSENNVSLVVMGHFHEREYRSFNGVTYVMSDNLNETELNPSYLVLSCGDKVNFEYVEL